MNKEIEIMAKTIYGEARGEYKKYGLKAFEAIAHVIMNRAREKSAFPSVVCLQPKQFSCWNKGDPNRKVLENVTIEDDIYRICYLVAKRAICGELGRDITSGANHYYSKCLKFPPYWAEKPKFKTTIGNHIFIKI